MTQNFSQESQPPQSEKDRVKYNVTHSVDPKTGNVTFNSKEVDSGQDEKGLAHGKCNLDPLQKAPVFDDISIFQNPPEEIKPHSAEDKELTALREYILDNGFVVSTVAFHIVTLCAQPMVTPATTNWDFADRAMIPDMVYALLKQPGYIEGIWPSLRIIMGTNKGNTAWCSAIATTIAFFDVIRTLPVIEELKT